MYICLLFQHKFMDVAVFIKQKDDLSNMYMLFYYTKSDNKK